MSNKVQNVLVAMGVLVGSLSVLYAFLKDEEPITSKRGNQILDDPIEKEKLLTAMRLKNVDFIDTKFGRVHFK